MKNSNNDEDIHSKALFVNKIGKDCYSHEIKCFKLDPISKEEIVIKSMYSSINYKDIMVSDGNPGLVRRYPHIPGIDVAGIVYKSKNNKIKVGDRVMVIARPLGIESYGGLSEYVKVPAAWVEKIPANISEKQAMIFGTAGFTAALAVQKLLTNKISTSQLPVLVTGASGGVGSMSIFLLKSNGFKVTALTSSLGNKSYLKSIGADEVISSSTFQKSINLPLLKETYSSIIDNIGGESVAVGIKTIQRDGFLILVGNIASSKFLAHVSPFLLRGVSIMGINAESCTEHQRKKIWRMIETYKNKNRIEKLYRVIKFDEISANIRSVKMNKHTGRLVVKIDDSLS